MVEVHTEFIHDSRLFYALQFSHAQSCITYPLFLQYINCCLWNGINYADARNYWMCHKVKRWLSTVRGSMFDTDDMPASCRDVLANHNASGPAVSLYAIFPENSLISMLVKTQFVPLMLCYRHKFTKWPCTCNTIVFCFSNFKFQTAEKECVPMLNLYSPKFIWIDV